MRILTLLFASLCLTLNAYSQVPAWIPADGLVAYYPLDSNASDLSTYGNDGTALNCTSSPDRHGNTNGSYSFNGTDSRMEVADAASLRVKKITIAMWVKLNAPGVQQLVTKSNFMTGSQETYFMNTDVEFGFKHNSACAFASPWKRFNYYSAPALQTWHFLASTYDGDTAKNYLDGVEVSAYPYAGSIDTCMGGALRFGYNWNTWHYALNGNLDDIAIYNRALSACEIAGMFNQETNLITAQTVSQNAASNGIAKFYVASAGTNTSYQWQLNAGAGFINLPNGGPYSGVTTDTLTISNPSTLLNNTSYRCIVSSTQACPDTSLPATLAVTTSVASLSNGKSVSVFPNPANSMIVVRISGAPQNEPFRIYNSSGQTVANGILNEVETTIDIDRFPGGLYFIKVEGMDRLLTILKY